MIFELLTTPSLKPWPALNRTTPPDPYFGDPQSTFSVKLKSTSHSLWNLTLNFGERSSENKELNIWGLGFLQLLSEVMMMMMMLSRTSGSGVLYKNNRLYYSGGR